MGGPRLTLQFYCRGSAPRCKLHLQPWTTPAMLVGAWPTPKWHILYILYIYDMWVNLAPQRAEKMAVEWECGTGIRPSFTEIFWYLKSSFSIWVLLAYVFNHDLTKHYWANFWVLNFLKIWYFLQREDGMGLNYHPSNTNSIDLDSTSNLQTVVLTWWMNLAFDLRSRERYSLPWPSSPPCL